MSTSEVMPVLSDTGQTRCVKGASTQTTRRVPGKNDSLNLIACIQMTAEWLATAECGYAVTDLMQRCRIKCGLTRRLQLK